MSSRRRYQTAGQIRNQCAPMPEYARQRSVPGPRREGRERAKRVPMTSPTRPNFRRKRFSDAGHLATVRFVVEPSRCRTPWRIRIWSSLGRRWAAEFFALRRAVGVGDGDVRDEMYLEAEARRLNARSVRLKPCPPESPFLVGTYSPASPTKGARSSKPWAKRSTAATPVCFPLSERGRGTACGLRRVMVERIGHRWGPFFCGRTHSCGRSQHRSPGKLLRRRWLGPVPRGRGARIVPMMAWRRVQSAAVQNHSQKNCLAQ